MSVKAKLLDLILQVHQEELSFIDGLSAADRAAVGAVDRWSPKDMLAHVIEWNLRMVRNYEAARRGEPVPSYGEIDHENAQIFEAHHAKSWDEVRAMVNEAHERVVAIVNAATEDDLTDPEKSPWPDKRRLGRSIAGNYLTHSQMHLAQFYAEHGRIDHATRVQENLAQALMALDDADDWCGTAKYNLACFYAIVGRKRDAIPLLAESLKLNPELTEWSKQDPDFASIREDPAYQALYT